MQPNRLRRNLWITSVGLGVNTVLSGGKLAAGLIGNSQALVADAIESFADIFSSLVVWRGVQVAAAPADANHPYGHGKAETIASGVVAGMLFVAAGEIAYRSIHSLWEPRQPPTWMTLWVLAGVVVIKELLFRLTLRQSRLTGSGAVRADAWHHRSDAITSLAAGAGITVALVGGPAFVAADSIAAAIASLIIAWNGLRLVRPVIDELMDAAPPSDLEGQIRQIAESDRQVVRVEKCFVRKSGHRYLVDMHVEVNAQMTVHDAHAVAHDVKDRILRQLPEIGDVLIHIEPAE